MANVFETLATKLGSQQKAVEAINAVTGGDYTAQAYNHWFKGRRSAPATVSNAALKLMGVDARLHLPAPHRGR